MRVSKMDYLREALFSAALFGSIGLAAAQAPAPGTDKDHAQQPSSIPDQNAKQEPGAKGAPPNSQAPQNTTAPAPGAFVNGALTAPGAAPDTDTTPAKFSQKNDQLDKMPILTRGVVLDDAQRKLIWESVMADSGAATASIEAGPSTELPYTVELREWPQDVTGKIPGVQSFKYVKTNDKILVVSPASRIVVGEIKR